MSAAVPNFGVCRTFDWCQVNHAEDSSWEELDDGRLECEHLQDISVEVEGEEDSGRVHAWVRVMEYRDVDGQSFSAPRLVIDTNGRSPLLTPVVAANLSSALVDLAQLAATVRPHMGAVTR